MKSIPALRVALTSQCNLNCEYCPPGGENFFNVRKPLGTKRLLRILKVFHEIGFRQFGFTGGEPLLNKNILTISKECSRLKGTFLKLYTNGILLKSKIGLLKGINLIKLSLDTVNLKKYKEITGRDKLRDVLEGIDAARKNRLKVRINAVLTKKNYGEVLSLINFCCNKRIDLKILDLNCFDLPGYLAWRNIYKSTAVVVNHLVKENFDKAIIHTVGNYGIPMSEFKLDGISIRIKNSKNSSTYSPVCRDCKYFLCQEGLYQLTLTSDGRIKMCWHRPDINADLSLISEPEIKRTILHFLEKHYFSAERVFTQKQVFLGCFGTKGGHERKKN